MGAASTATSTGRPKAKNAQRALEETEKGGCSALASTLFAAWPWNKSSRPRRSFLSEELRSSDEMGMGGLGNAGIIQPEEVFLVFWIVVYRLWRNLLRGFV